MMTNLYIGLLCLISLTKAKALSETTLILTSSNFTALKPGLRSASSNSTSCEQECTSNADCIGDWICCTRLCGPSFHLAPPEEPLATTTPILIVTPPQYDGEPAYIQLPEDPVVRAEEGNYVTMSCNATGNSRPTVSWRKDAKQIDSTISRHRILNDGALQIVGLYRSDAGIYTCTANNSLGTAARVEYQLDVTDPHVRSSSIIGEEKNEVTVAMNSPAQLNCYAIGWPRPSVTWWHEDAMVPLTSDVYEQRQDHSLLIRSVTLSSLGVYTCLTFNGIQRPSLWSVTLQAHGPVHDVNPEHQKYMNYLVYLPTTTDPTHEDQTDIFTETYRGPLNVNVSAPRNRVPEGSEVTITCDVDKYFIKGIQWYKDGNIIRTEHRMQITTKELVIPNAKREDSGTYLCVAYESLHNRIGSGAVTIKVLVPVKLNVSVPQTKFPEGSKVSITCNVDGFWTPGMRWYKDDNVIQPNERMQIIAYGLIISDAKRKDTGTYRCEAYDSMSDKIGSGTVTIKVLVPVKLNVSVPQNKFPESSEISITCNVDGFLTPEILWYKNDNVIQANEKTQIIANGLIISEAKRRDSGTYRCEAYDSLSDKIGSGAVTIRVLVPSKLNVSVPQKKFPEGSEVSITCNVDGLWTPGVRWYKNDNVIQSNERRLIIAYGLIISDAERRDSGTYRCEAYDWMNEKIGSGTVIIEVLVPVKLNVSVPQNKFSEGSEVSITCNVDGFLTPEIRWYKDNNVIQSNERTQIIEAYGLIISDAKRKDSGTYRCEAYDSMSDKIGSGAVTIKVLVPVKLNVSVLQNKILEGSEVSITCNVDGFLTPEIRWYKGDKVIQPNERMQIIAYGLIIPDAERRDNGTYRCEAYDSMCDKIGSGAVTIEVLVPVKLNVSVPQSKFPYGGDISIACVVDGYPIPRILWYKDENLIQTDNRVLISEVNELIISRANSDDSGTYRCEATNQFSTRSGSVEIEVSVDECLLPGRCSHFCDNEKGSIKCSCATGYLRDPQDLTRCKAAEGHASLLVGVSGNIFNITLDGQEMTAIVNNSNRVKALDFDFRTGMIFWGDFTEKKIYKAPIDEGNHRTMIIDRVHNDINSLAVDWIYNHIYWIDNVKSTIDLANFEGNMRKTLITERLNWPLAIALNPLEGWMFWTDWGGWWDNPRIERAGMDGSHRSIIVETEVREPYGLTLDSIGRRLYWVDYELKTIASCNYDGSERRTILNSPDTLRGPWSITTFEDHVYWMNYHTNDIFRANKFTGKDVERVTSSFSQYAYVLHVYHPYTQPDGKNQCQEGNGNCTHLCLPAPIISSKSPLLSCACPDGLKLMPDGLTCSENGH